MASIPLEEQPMLARYTDNELRIYRHHHELVDSILEGGVLEAIFTINDKVQRVAQAKKQSMRGQGWESKYDLRLVQSSQEKGEATLFALKPTSAQSFEGEVEGWKKRADWVLVDGSCVQLWEKELEESVDLDSSGRRVPVSLDEQTTNMLQFMWAYLVPYFIL